MTTARRSWKAKGAALLSRPPARWLLRPWAARDVPILMLHRFSATGGEGGATSAETLAGSLAALREQGLTPVSLGALCSGLAENSPPQRAVCLTVDDGYDDFRSVAAPVLARFGPATVFITSRFIDGELWFWWDRIEYVFDHTRKGRVAVALGNGRDFTRAWDSPRARDAVRDEFTRACKEVGNDVKWAAIAALEQALDVAVPERPTGSYRGMTWDDVRALQKQGIEFGGHTVNHPILSKVSREEAEWEVVEGLRAIERNTGVKPTTFAYPNGRECDFTDDVIRVLKQEGVAGAVTGEWGIVSRRKLASLADPLYRLPRIGMPPNVDGFVQAVSGLESLKQDLGYV